MRAASSVVLGGLGLTVAVVLAAGVAGIARAPAASASAADDHELVVGMHLAVPGLRAGALRRGEIVAATGLEADVVRAVAGRLGARSLRVVAVADRRALTRAGARSWDVAVGGIGNADAGGASRSIGYVLADPVVLMRPGLPRPRSVADLRRRLLCAVRGTAGARAARRFASVFPTVVVDGDAELVRLVGSGRCDAAIREAPELGAMLERIGGRHGHVGGRIATGAALVFAVPEGSTLRPELDRALRRLRADGTLARIARRWLGFDPSGVRVLR
jgi:ABC-type amino acid transport substrate-binding protein